jgi:hypothetical protein
MDARQAHLSTLRLITETRGKRTHQDWSRIIALTAARMQPLLRDIRLERLKTVYDNMFEDGGKVVWDHDPNEIRAVFGACGKTIWGLTEDLKWLKVVRTRGHVKVVWVDSPGDITTNTGDLDEHVYAYLWAVARKRKARLEQKVEIATNVLAEFEAEVNLFQIFPDREP